MGMDVYALRPKDSTNKHFVVNIWEWRAIHDLMTQVAGHLFPADVAHKMQFNDGAGLSRYECQPVAKAIKEYVIKHKVKSHTLHDKPLLKALGLNTSPYTVSRDRLLLWAAFVEESGGFEVH